MIFDPYFFVLLVSLLILGNLFIRMKGEKKAQLYFNSIILYLIILSISVYSLSGTQESYFNIISINPFSLFFIMILTIGVLLLNFLAYTQSNDYGDFALLSSLALVGMYLVVAATSLITIFIGLELMSIPSAFIILLSRRNSLEAATKFFIMASVAIALLSFAIVLLYGASNSLMLQAQNQGGLLNFAFVLFIASIGFEASVFPFNVLLPDVYEGSAAYATALLGGINKKVGLAALMQVLIFLFIGWSFVPELVALLAVLAMFYGNIVALMQNNLKRLLAYSSISQVGYILIGIAVANQAGVAASMFQIFAHMFLFIGAMGIITWLERKGKGEISDLIGLYKENRVCALALSLFLLSLAGIPFTTGFMGKFLLFLSAVNAGLAWLALLGVVNSVISIFYYAKVLTAVYTDKLGTHHIKLDSPTLAVILVCVIITLLIGIYPQPMIQLVNGAAWYLFSGIR
jgi:NADH-quinone oxidoreductase subunit N